MYTVDVTLSPMCIVRGKCILISYRYVNIYHTITVSLYIMLIFVILLSSQYLTPHVQFYVHVLLQIYLMFSTHLDIVQNNFYNN